MIHGMEAVRAERSASKPPLLRFVPYGAAIAGAATAAGLYLLVYFRSDPNALLGALALLSSPVFCVLLPDEMAEYRGLTVPERDHLPQRQWRRLTALTTGVLILGLVAIALPVTDLHHPYGIAVLAAQLAFAAAAVGVSSFLQQQRNADPRRIYGCRPRLGYCRDCDTRVPLDTFDATVRAIESVATTTLLTDPESGKSYMVEMVDGRRVLEETAPVPGGRLTRTYTLADPPGRARILRVVGYTDHDPRNPDIVPPLLGLVLGDPVTVEALALDGSEIRALTARLRRAADASRP